jgi:hypothetical protein
LEPGIRLRRDGIDDIHEAVRIGIASRRASRRGLFTDEYLDSFDVHEETIQMTRLLNDGSKRSSL